MVTRRQFLATAAVGVGGALAAPALIGLARKGGRPIAGGFVEDGSAAGHAIRDRSPLPPRAESRQPRAAVVIIGGGIAGLSAAWELDRRGMRDFVVLELESRAGGNAGWGENEVTAYPWAAHYVPVPGPRATLVRELFEELGLLKDGVWDERHLCFSPQERLFLYGEWIAGLEPTLALDRRGRDEMRRFAEMADELHTRGEFTIPMALGAHRDSPLDRMTMTDWMRENGLTHPAMRWYVDYACRDDYGALARDTSAWAGLHYFASREREEPGPLTWPEGNGWITKRLLARLGDRVRVGAPVRRVSRDGARWRVDTADASWLADAVVFAAPQFVAPYVIEGLERWRPERVYTPWLTANVTLERWPRERAGQAEPAWDNVIYDSPGLGYVVATHQSLRSQPPRQERTVWTYYRSLAELAPIDGRRLLAGGDWAGWRDRILADLARAHPDIRDCVSRIDVMRHGHAMVSPAPGFLTASGATPPALPRLHFAHSDVSGLSLFEEAQYRGVEAARRAMGEIG